MYSHAERVFDHTLSLPIKGQKQYTKQNICFTQAGYIKNVYILRETKRQRLSGERMELIKHPH